ncbi:MAG: S8 family peptidase [Gemmatimonadaceae bacterium]|nr:S8 family peptidase [Gemmatimonadaceae bacterium]
MVKKIAQLATLGLVAAACSDGAAPVGPSRLAPYIEPSGDLTAQLVPGEYIVVLNDNVADVAGAAAASGANVIARWEKALKGYAFRGNAEQVRLVRADPRVKSVEPNGRATIVATQSPTPSWGLDRIDQANLPLNNSYTYPNTASNVHAYTIDTGIMGSHNDFGGRVSTTSRFDAITPGGTANDCHGHGTHVSGTIGGTAYGVAKGVTLHAVRVLDCSGSGTWQQVISGINWVAANRVLPAVANMSLGGSLNTAVNQATAGLVAAGVFTAVASGNSSANACNYSPASEPTATTVNSSTNTDARSSFSNFGTCTDIFAPGSNITSAWIGGNNATNTISGTSMATPHVAGAGALYLSANPSATPAQVDAALKGGATLNKITNPGTGSPNRLLNISFIGGNPPPNNKPPVADFTITCVTTNPHKCTLNAAPSTDDGGFGNLTFTWTNTVGRPAKTGTKVSYLTSVHYANSFDVTLTAKDSGNLTHSVTKTVTIP